jgi:peptidoglycan hydrolase-like protein with peptidoglycan-binding domain
MACESTHRTRILFVALVAVLVALSIPATGHAAERDRLASAGVLERGAGYGSAGGSHAVRVLQARLGRSGDRPGPIDGLYGPLTQGAVQRFQQRHGLAVDGIVGRQTRRALFAGTTRPTASPDERNTKPGTLTRKSPSPSIGLESAGEQPHARPVPADVASRAGPVSGTSGVPPELIAALAALAGLMLFLTLRKQGEVRLNFGLTCAVLLAVFGIGAVAGALFATRAAPQATDRAAAGSGILLAGTPARERPRHTAAARDAGSIKIPVAAASARTRSVRSASAPAHPVTPTSTELASGSIAPAVSPAAPIAPVVRAAPRARPAATRRRAATYVVKPGDSLSNIARSELSAASDSRVRAEVQKLAQLNLGRRIRSGDPDVLETGEELRLR